MQPRRFPRILVTQDRPWLRYRGMLSVMSTRDEEIYRSCAGELTRYATGLVGPFDAPDVVTDAFLKASGSSRWDQVDNHRAYLYRTVLTVAMDHHRSSRARRAREQRAAVPAVAHQPEIDYEILDVVERLSVKQRAAVMLTYWSDLPADEVGRLMGVSEGTVKRHLDRARKRLKEWLS